MPGEDEFVSRFLGAPDTQEAQAWLQAASADDFRSLGEDESTEESLALVRELYAAGAEEVLAVEIEEYDEGQNTGKIVIKLPRDADSRAAVLVIANDLIQSQGFDPEVDTGQSYVFVMLD